MGKGSSIRGSLHDVGNTLSISSVVATSIPAKSMDDVVKNPEAIDALNALDIDPEDHKILSDILDPDQSGEITVAELVQGLKRLRGEPRRSDIITVDLMVRSLQRKMDELQRTMKSMGKQFGLRSTRSTSRQGTIGGLANSVRNSSVKAKGTLKFGNEVLCV